MRSQLDWKQSLSKLIEGNMRFRLGLRSVESFASSLRLKEFAEKGQSPSAIILTCSDSRVPTEILFDKGVGDLFVIRVAGNVISDTTIASVEYAALVLQTPLCVVMGHTQCGAVRAAVNKLKENSPPSTESVEALLKKIIPSAAQAFDINPSSPEDELVRLSTVLNVRRQVGLIKMKSKALNNLAQEEKFRVVGALYDLHEGEVSFDMEDVPKIKIEDQFPAPALKEMSFLTK